MVNKQYTGRPGARTVPDQGRNRRRNLDNHKTTTMTVLSTKQYEQKSWNFVTTENQNCEMLTVFMEKTVKTNAIFSKKLSK